MQTGLGGIKNYYTCKAKNENIRHWETIWWHFKPMPDRRQTSKAIIINS